MDKGPAVQKSRTHAAEISTSIRYGMIPLWFGRIWGKTLSGLVRRFREGGLGSQTEALASTRCADTSRKTPQYLLIQFMAV